MPRFYVNMSLSILLEYRLFDSSEWQTIEMLPEDYFDLEPNEKIEWDCLPLYDNAIGYLDIDPKLVSNTRIRIIDNKANITKVITTTFWNQGKNQIVERIDKGPGIFYWLTILTIKLQDNPPVWEILRIPREDDVAKLEFHSFIQDNEDGSETEKIIYPPNY